MGKDSSISWTNHTWNPWYGCHKVSQGCRHCYMFREQSQYGRDPNVVVRSKTTFNSPIGWNKTSGGSLVFTCSWSDFFIEEADEWRDEAWAIIRRTPNLTYQILTKRPERISKLLPLDWADFSNVWLGVSAETQKDADKRLPELLRIPAVVHFVSVEPMLEIMDITNYLFDYRKDPMLDHPLYGSRLDWVICGGESGPEARMLHRDWVRFIRDQCIRADVPFFFKQWSGLHPAQECELDGVHWRQFPDVYTNSLVTTKLL